MSIDVSALRMATEKLHTWIQSIPVNDIHRYADRALCRGMMKPDPTVEADFDLLKAAAPKVLATLGSELNGDDATSCLIVLETWRRWKLENASALNALVEAQWPLWHRALPQTREPWRSAVAFWAHKIGLLNAPDPGGRTPQNPTLRLYHWLHLALYKSDYTQSALKRIDLPVVDKIEALVVEIGLERNADVIAECLLIEGILTPPNPERIAALTALLLATQQSDGSLSLNNASATLSNRHHAGVVAACALQKVLLNLAPQT